MKGSILFCLFFGMMLFALSECTTSNGKQIMEEELEDVIEKEQEVTEDPYEGREPQALYAEFCASCHGVEMKAFVDRDWDHGTSDENLTASIKVGIDQDGMPGYGDVFTDEEIGALVAYIQEGIKDRDSYDSSIRDTPKMYVSDHYNLVVDTVVNDIEVPWGIKVTADGTIYFTEREGRLKIKKPDGTLVNVRNVPTVKNEGQGGMLDVCLHPDFGSNQLIYLSYSKPMTAGGTTAVIRGRLSGDELVDQMSILEGAPHVNTRYHYGSRMVFDNEGYLYVCIGDRGRRDDHPQFLTNSFGKVHRVHDDGRIPADNPFADAEVPSIWSYGHRNPQGMVIDLESDALWVHEHGPRGGDELNNVKAGKNYGWPVVSYGLNYDGTTFTEVVTQDGYVDPVHFWIPSIAPSGMAFINRQSQYPEWSGDILSGSLRFDYISRISLDGERVESEERILDGIGRVRSIELGADGYLYVGVENPGRILKVSVQ